MTELITALDKANMMLTSLGANNTAFLTDAKKQVYAMQKQQEALVRVITSFVYETTCLSPQEDDGSHWCKMSKETLEAGRAALKSIKE